MSYVRITNMYEPNSAKTLRVCIVGDTDLQKSKSWAGFCDILNDQVFGKLTTNKKFILETTMIELGPTVNLTDYNFIFFLTNLTDCATIIDTVRTIGFVDVRNHVFIVIDGCDDMETDDDYDLVFNDDTDAEMYNSFVKKVTGLDSYKKIFSVYRLSSVAALIYHKLLETKSVSDLTEKEINYLANKLVKNSSKLQPADRKRELKKRLAKIDLNDKLTDTGYTKMFESISKYLKPTNQKNIVNKNYLTAIDQCRIEMNVESSIEIILSEISTITYLKPDALTEFIDLVQDRLVNKLDVYFKKIRPSVAIDSTLLSSTDAYTYNKFLSGLLESCAESESYPIVSKLIETEISSINKMIVNHYNKEVEKITDLDKIASAFKVFSVQDKDNVGLLFDKTKSNPKIISENMSNMNKWVEFIDACMKINIKKASVIELVELIIMEKIKYSVDMTNTTRPDSFVIYPHCLSTFVIKNISLDFVFEKLHMFLSCNIRYSGRNIPELVKALTKEKYDKILVLEYKLLELVGTK